MLENNINWFKNMIINQYKHKKGNNKNKSVILKKHMQYSNEILSKQVFLRDYLIQKATI